MAKRPRRFAYVITYHPDADAALAFDHTFVIAGDEDEAYDKGHVWVDCHHADWFGKLVNDYVFEMPEDPQ